MRRILGTMVVCGTWIVLAGSAAAQDSMNAFGGYPYGFAAGMPAGTYAAGSVSTPPGYSFSRQNAYSTFTVSRLTGPPVSYAGSAYTSSAYAGGVSNYATPNYSAYSYSRRNYPAYGALGAYGYRTYSYRPGLFGPRSAGR